MCTALCMVDLKTNTNKQQGQIRHTNHDDVKLRKNGFPAAPPRTLRLMAQEDNGVQSNGCVVTSVVTLPVMTPQGTPALSFRWPPLQLYAIGGRHGQEAVLQIQGYLVKLSTRRGKTE